MSEGEDAVFAYYTYQIDGYFQLLPPCPKRIRDTGGGRMDWHPKARKDEPPCSGNQWRTKDRYEVVNIRDMSDNHLKHATRFAATKPQHSSRLAALLAEGNRRNRK